MSDIDKVPTGASLLLLDRGPYRTDTQQTKAKPKVLKKAARRRVRAKAATALLNSTSPQKHRPKGTFILSGARPGIDRSYRISGVTHKANRSGGATTGLELKQPGGGAGTDTR